MKEPKSIIRIVESILTYAQEHRVSEITGFPTANGTSITYSPAPNKRQPFAKKSGRVLQGKHMDHKIWRQVCTRLKIMSGMDTGAQTKCQDGILETTTRGDRFKARINIRPGTSGEHVVIRTAMLSGWPWT